MTSSRRSSISGSAAMAAVTSRGEDVAIHGERVAAGDARLLRGLEQQRIRRRSSSLSSQGAVDSDSLLSELLHTSSASRSVWCAGVGRTGRISCSTHGQTAAGDLPRRFACRRVRRR